MSIYIKHRQTSLYLSGFHLNTCKRNKDWVQVQSHLTDSIRSGKLCRILDEAVYTKQAEVPTSTNVEVSWRRCWFCQLSPLTYNLRVIGKHVRLNSPVCKHADNKYLLNLHPLLFPFLAIAADAGMICQWHESNLCEMTKLVMCVSQHKQR